MTTKHVEVLVGKQADENIEENKVGRSVAATPAQEVEGRHHYWRWAQFSCGHICHIWYDTNRYHAYECCFDGTVNVF